MNEQQTIKLCACGCGEPLVKSSNKFINGHNRKGIKRSIDSLEKAKKTNIIKYGVENPFQSNEIKQKIKNTCLQKYGTENPYQSKLVQEKYKKTCMSKYNVTNPSQLQQVKEKSKITCLKKYNTEFSFQSKDVRKKSKQTMIQKYGAEHHFQNITILTKCKLTCRKHYGVDFPFQSKFIINKVRDMCKLKNINWVNQTPECRRKSRISAIKRIEKQISNNEPLMPTIGNQERIFLDELQKYSKYQIIRNDPSFRYVVGRFPDGHIPELKLFIQFDERYHFVNQECTQYREDDIRCTKDLESVPGYRVFRVSQKDWDNNKQQMISKFLNYLSEEIVV